MSKLTNIQRKISEGVSGWLLFEFHCFRGYIFNEKYLSYPISQILNSITEYKTLAEQNHPLGNKTQGRPLQVDFVLSDNLSNWKYAFESKWVGNTTISIGSIVWDLIRLQNLFLIYPDIKCYFILAGFDKKINLLLEDFEITHNKNSIKTGELTTVNPNYLKFHLNKLDEKDKGYINKKIKGCPNFRLFSKVFCRPATCYPRNDSINMSFKTYIFEVLPPDKTLRIDTLSM